DGAAQQVPRAHVREVVAVVAEQVVGGGGVPRRHGAQEAAELVHRLGSAAQRDALPPSMTTHQARDRVAEARARMGRRLIGTPWTLNARVPGTWLRDGPYAPDPTVRRPLDAALHRGSLTLRGYDRVLRVAWSLADLEGHDRLAADHIGRALFLKRGAAA
ncbi:MAG: hypothetical protein J0H70_10005, partial [Microbacterium chocolatum]|nr:hypothetical protein [Microbacterium chocolatum]